MLPLAIATALALLVLDGAGFAPIRSVRRSAFSVGSPLSEVIAWVAEPVTSTWNGMVHYDEVAEENRRLRHRLAELEGAADGRPDIEAELGALLAATNIEYLDDVDQVTARVVANRRTELEWTVEIDKGTGDGIARGMPVVTGHGLVGKVELVVEDRAVVRLLSDPELAVGVRSVHGLGLVVGTAEGRLHLEPGPELTEALRIGAVSEDERFVTSGVDRSAYPPGIPVGTLRSSTGELSPLVDIGRLGYLTVLLIENAA